MSNLTAYLEPPVASDSTRAQAVVRDAPQFFAARKRDLKLPYPLNLLVSNESQEKWVAYENILIASIQTGDFSLAKQCVEALTERFGKMNERIIILKGIYDEAVASNDTELKTILKRYEDIISESPTMFGVRKRRVALLKSMGKTTEAVAALVDILDASPTDAEAWVELADLYQNQGLLDQTIFSLEEALLVVPNAWNIHAKLGEVLYLNASRAEGSERLRLLSESARRFCRSIELSSEYLRGYYGLKQVSLQHEGLVGY